MINQSNKVLNTNITKLVNKTYQYGFSTKIENDIIEKGLNEKTIQLISEKKQESSFLLSFRLKAYKRWKQMAEPEWPYLKFPQINYQDLTYYSAPKLQKKLKDINEVDPELLKTFEKLGISLTEQKRLANVAIDAVFLHHTDGGIAAVYVQMQQGFVVVIELAVSMQKLRQIHPLIQITGTGVNKLCAI